jgi:hypothetical protein
VLHNTRGGGSGDRSGTRAALIMVDHLSLSAREYLGAFLILVYV